VSVIPVLLLGVVLGFSYNAEARRRGLAEGRSEATLLAQTAVEHALGGHLLDSGLTTPEQIDVARMSQSAVRTHAGLRLRLRDLEGRVVFSDDGSGLASRAPDDEALEAVRGEPVTLLTRLNMDSND